MTERHELIIRRLQWKTNFQTNTRDTYRKNCFILKRISEIKRNKRNLERKREQERERDKGD